MIILTAGHRMMDQSSPASQQFFVIMNKATTNIPVKFFCGSIFLILLDK